MSTNRKLKYPPARKVEVSRFAPLNSEMVQELKVPVAGCFRSVDTE